MAAVSQVSLWLAVKDSLTKYTHYPAGSSKKKSSEMELVPGVFGKTFKCVVSIFRCLWVLYFQRFEI